MGNPQLDLGGCSADQFAEIMKVLYDDTAAALVLCKVFSTRDRTEEVAFGLNTVFTVLSGALVFIMHGGFAMLEAGAIRSKNAMNILLQTVLDGAASAIMWYLVGFGFAYGIGDRPNGFIGDALFGLSRYASHNTGTGVGNWTNWFFQWAFCATAATIPAGSVAERFNFNAYLGYSLFLGGFVYPVVVHWVWCPTGWLGYGCHKPLLGAGFIDFAGSGVVHLTGGLAGLTGAVMVGPRLGRFDSDGKPVHMPGHSAILVVLGTVLLWFGWYGFNPGSALLADTRASAMVAGRAAVTTTLSGAAGGLMCLMLGFVRNVSWDLISLCNGMLVGFVSVTAGCHVLEPWAALLCGASAALVFEGGCALLLRLRIDDVVSAGPMHGFCGAWGVFFVGLLAKEEYIKQAYNRNDYPYGLFYGGGGRLLASQVIGLLAIFGWVVGLMGPFFGIFKWARALRISANEEHSGLDVSKHGGSAYNTHQTTQFCAPSLAALQIAAGSPGVHAMSRVSRLQYGATQPSSLFHMAPGSGGMSKTVGDSIMRAATIGFNASGGAGAGGGVLASANASAHTFHSSHPSYGNLAANDGAGTTANGFAAPPGNGVGGMESERESAGGPSLVLVNIDAGPQKGAARKSGVVEVELAPVPTPEGVPQQGTSAAGDGQGPKEPAAAATATAAATEQSPLPQEVHKGAAAEKEER